MGLQNPSHSVHEAREAKTATRMRLGRDEPRRAPSTLGSFAGRAGSSSIHSCRCVLYPWPSILSTPGSSLRHLTAADALSIPVLRLGRLCLAFSTRSSTVSLSMHSRIRPSSKLRIPLAHLGNFFSYSPSSMHSHITAIYHFNPFSVQSLFFPPTLPFCKTPFATLCHLQRGRGGEGGSARGTAPGGEEYSGGEKGGKKEWN